MTASLPAEFMSEPVIEGPTFTKALSTPDPVPEAGIQRARELMESGALFRYTPGVLSETAVAESEICEYTGFKYAVGFNSCGSALFIALKCLGVQPGDAVLANGFSFTAVPSAIHHAGAKPDYVECTDSFVLDIEDLKARITPESKYLMLTHMRGKVTDMQAVYELAAEHNLQVVEDCAHALGVQWDGVQLGRSAKVACFSCQSAKVINAGEGGFLCTDDPEIAARAACYAGCYEQLYLQHVVAPPAEVFDKVKFETPNYSLRMSDLTATCVRPQIVDLEERIATYNARYAHITSLLEGCPHMYIPPISPRVRPVSDSLQINLLGMSQEQVSAFLAATKARGMPVGLFGSKENARNFRNWKYAPSEHELPETERMIAAAIDVRLPLVFEMEDFDQMAAVLLAAVEDVMGVAAAKSR
jgi:dTDP-4-amino-4,6-dideoxygalactose transaminase